MPQKSCDSVFNLRKKSRANEYSSQPLETTWYTLSRSFCQIRASKRYFQTQPANLNRPPSFLIRRFTKPTQHHPFFNHCPSSIFSIALLRVSVSAIVLSGLDPICLRHFTRYSDEIGCSHDQNPLISQDDAVKAFLPGLPESRFQRDKHVPRRSLVMKKKDLQCRISLSKGAGGLTAIPPSAQAGSVRIFLVLSCFTYRKVKLSHSHAEL